jgi:hypothetical protein
LASKRFCAGKQQHAKPSFEGIFLREEAILGGPLVLGGGEDACERYVGTVFQLPNPDAIYSRDEGKERRWLPPLVVCVCARLI